MRASFFCHSTGTRLPPGFAPRFASAAAVRAPAATPAGTLRLRGTASRTAPLVGLRRGAWRIAGLAPGRTLHTGRRGCAPPLLRIVGPPVSRFGGCLFFRPVDAAVLRAVSACFRIARDRFLPALDIGTGARFVGPVIMEIGPVALYVIARSVLQLPRVDRA